ncbi:unnamed protein product, partial [Polarella glacialis]
AASDPRLASGSSFGGLPAFGAPNVWPSGNLGLEGPEASEAWASFGNAFKQYLWQLAETTQQRPGAAGPEADRAELKTAAVAAAFGGLRSDKACMSHLAGTCVRGMRCSDRHPPQAQFTRILADLKRKQCSFGDKCLTKKCFYFHPREAEAETQN